MIQKIDNLMGDYDISNLWMGTFHSICLRILRRHLKQIGYQNNFLIYDSEDSKKSYFYHYAIT